MLGSSSRRKAAEELVKDLLVLVRQLSEIDPSPSIRERLHELASHRLGETTEKHRLGLNLNGGRAKRLVPALAGTLLILLLAGRQIVIHVRQKAAQPAQTAVTICALENSLRPSAAVARASLPQWRRTSHPGRPLQPTAQTEGERLTVRLPYSNVAIANGTSVTVRVAMSPSELLALGFPMSPTLQDGRVVAELSLGDDGLPRAISLPLPLEFVKEAR